MKKLRLAQCLKSMQLIRISRPGTQPEVIRTLDHAEHTLLSNSHVNTDDNAIAQDFLRYLWQHRYWLTCDCRGHASSRPLLYVKRSYQGLYYLACMPDRPPHSSDCIFNAKSVIDTENKIRRSLSDLSKLFFRWFAAARLNIVYPYSSDDILASQYAGLREVSRSIDIVNGRHLADFSDTHIDALPRIGRRLRNAEQDWPGDGAPFGFILSVIDSVDDGVVCLDARGIRLDYENVYHLPGALDSGGPFAVLLQISKDAEFNLFLPEKVFIHPVLSRDYLMPIDYHQERQTLHTLLKVQQQLLQQQQILISIKKTLPYTQSQDRGIAFHVQRLGPNGRVLRTIDVVSVSSYDLRDSDLLTESESDAVIYHVADQCSNVLSLADKSFYQVIIDNLLQDIDTQSYVDSVTTKAEAVAL